MRRLVNIFSGVVLLIGSVFIASCSSDYSETDNAVQDFNVLRFIVKVDNGNANIRSATGKTGWTVGDKIIVAIDDNDSNLCNLEYRGDGEWNVTRLDGNTSFSSETGNLSAVYADKLSAGANGIITEGDVLYTQNGTYTRHGNVVSISLRMDKRPVSRIAVVGMDSTCWIDGMEVYDNVESIVDARWAKDRFAGSDTYKEIYGDTCIFYGTLAPNADGSTTFHLLNPDGAVYARSYISKSMAAGDYIIIYGPESSEGEQWARHVPVTGITARSSNISLLVDDTGNVSDWYSLSPANPSNTNVNITSSTPSVLTVNNGVYKAVSKGNATVTIATKDGGHSCSVRVNVSNILDLVTIEKTGARSTLITPYGYYYGSTFNIRNNSDFDIYVTELDGAVSDIYEKKLDGVVSDGKLLVSAHSSERITNYYHITGYYKTIKLVFICNDKTYEKSGEFEI